LLSRDAGNYSLKTHGARVQLSETVRSKAMVYEGIIQNGVVVLANGIHLPEGAPVRVELLNKKSDEAALSPDDAALLNMDDLAFDTGIHDLSVNINHYLYGHPKVTDGQ
jgi:hypothetical protein